MEKLPQTQAIAKAFPWGRLESDGTFSFDIARGRFGVLGGSGYGYWSHCGSVSQSEGYGSDIGGSRKLANNFEHLDGKDLIGKNHLSEEEGWKLPSNLIPYLNLLSPSVRPELVTKFNEQGGIIGWDSWYRWRKLSKESPVALLINFPLSVYQMVVNCLGVTSSNAGRPDKHVNLTLHLLDADVELNFLPLCV